MNHDIMDATRTLLLSVAAPSPDFILRPAIWQTAARNKAKKAIEVIEMRTIKRLSLKLNKGKWEAVSEMAQAFAADKQLHLDFYQTGGNFAAASGWRERRDAVKQSDHHQSTLLPVHASDLAIKEAFDTELKYWASIAEKIDVRDRKWTNEQKHYANWLLFDGQRFSTLIEGRAPINQKINLTLQERKQVQNHLRRRAREIMKDRPRVRMARSFVAGQ